MSRKYVSYRCEVALRLRLVLFMCNASSVFFLAGVTIEDGYQMGGDGLGGYMLHADEDDDSDDSEDEDGEGSDGSEA
jgi:hypothetical protein